MIRAWQQLARLQRALGRLNAVLLRVCRVGVASALALLASIVLLQVVCRYVLGNALAWPEEVAKLLMVWMAFLGAPVAYARGEHARVTMLSGALAPRERALATAVVDAMVAALSLCLALYALPVVHVGLFVRATTVPVPMAWVYAAFPTGMFLLASTAVEACLARLLDAHRASPAKTLERARGAAGKVLKETAGLG